MSDLNVTLPTPESAENIPAALAAPKGKRKAARPADAFPGGPATFADDASSLPPAAASADTPIEEPIMADTIENVTETATQKTQAMFGEMKDRAEGAMGKGQALFADWTDMNKGNVEALVESGKLAVAGMQTLAQDRAAFVRGQFEATTAAFRSMTSVKSPTDFVKLSGDLLRQQFDAMVAETSRSTEQALKLAGEVAQPISNRMALAAEKVRLAA